MQCLAALVGCVALALLAGCAGPGQEQITLKPRPSTHGLFLPYPTRVPTFRADTSVATTELIRAIRFTIVVNERGRVDSLVPIRKRDSSIVRFYRDHLTSLHFQPGIRDTVVVPMRLPVVLYVGALGTAPVLTFPVEVDRGVVNTDLYHEALALNGIQAPTLKLFPSYSCTKFQAYQSMIYRTALFRVELDAGGRPTEVTPVMSTCEGYVDQLRSACLWAEYSPAKIDGKAVPFTAYLFVSFFPDVDCPTAPLVAEASAMWTLKDRMRVRLFADTIGLAAPPLPIRAWDGTISRADITELSPGRQSVLLEIDTLGNGHVQLVSPLPPGHAQLVSPPPPGVVSSGKVSWTCMRIANTLYRSYPALDFHGHPQPFRGLMHMAFENEDSIRIWVDWLSADRFLDVP